MLLVVHGGLFAATYVLLGLLVMSTDPCGYQKCGDPAWIDRAMNLNIWAGAAPAGHRHRGRGGLAGAPQAGVFVPIIGCLAQVALAVAAAAMELRAGPV